MSLTSQTSEYTCDDVDRAIVGLVRAEPRMTNRAIATALGVSVATVANRLRLLKRHNVLAFTIIADWDAAGYRSCGRVFIGVGKRSIEDVADDLAALPAAQFVVLTLGSNDLFVKLLAHRPEDLMAAVDSIRAIRGVASLDVDLDHENMVWASGEMALPAPPWNPADLPEPIVSLDELDRDLIEILANDGSRSNREVARTIGVSEFAVRSRLARLEQSGLLRVAAVVDPYAFGTIGVAAYVRIATESTRETVSSRLAVAAPWRALNSSIGADDFVGFISGADHNELCARVDDVRSVEGVTRVLTAVVVRTRKAKAHLGRLSASAPSPGLRPDRQEAAHSGT